MPPANYPIPRKPNLKNDVLLRKSKRRLDQKLNDGYVLILQQMPPKASLFKKTTCAHPLCSSGGHVSEPGSYRISIEPEINLKKDHVPLDAVASIPKLNRSRASMLRLCGLGIQDVEWYCLTCLEDLCAGEGMIEPVIEEFIPPAHPLASIAEHINPEKREVRLGKSNDTRSNYKLSSAQIYAVEKWKAVVFYTRMFSDEENLELLKTNNDINFCGPDGEWPREHYLGDEPRLLYLSKETKEAKGFLKDRDIRAEVSASQVRGRKLSEVLGLVDRAIEKFEAEELENPNIVDAWGNERSEVIFNEKGSKPKRKRVKLTLTLRPRSAREDGSAIGVHTEESDSEPELPHKAPGAKEKSGPKRVDARLIRQLRRKAMSAAAAAASAPVSNPVVKQGPEETSGDDSSSSSSGDDSH